MFGCEPCVNTQYLWEGGCLAVCPVLTFSMCERVDVWLCAMCYAAFPLEETSWQPVLSFSRGYHYF